MLKQRVVTSFALLFLILGAIYGLSAELFSFFVALVIGIAAWEWAGLSGLMVIPARIAYMLLIGAMLFISNALDVSTNLLLIPGIFWWGVAFLLVCFYPQSKKIWANRLFLLVAGVLLFIPGWQAFVYLRSQEYYAFNILLLLGLVAAADIGAYFSGRAFGSRKLAPTVSPNKTWEGYMGGVLACSFLITIVTLGFISGKTEMTLSLWVRLVVSAFIIASFSVIGDLFESMVKRYRDVKDSGTILPGHGGLLDRIDGLTASAPVYAMLLIMQGREFL